MRRGSVVLLALAAAIAAPLRAACATTCVDAPGAVPVAHHALATAVAEVPPPCHEPGRPPADEPAAPCTHNHDASLEPAVRSNVDAATMRPALTAAPAMAAPDFGTGVSLILAPLDITRGSPPPRLLPLRI